MIIESVDLIYVDAKANNNKWWKADLLETGEVVCNWGRVGAKSGQSKTFYGGKKFLTKKAKEKIRKGYVEQHTVKSTTKTIPVDVTRVAKTQIKTSSPTLDKLVDRLIRFNIHQITSHSQISFDGGIFQTPLGVVTPQGITKASGILSNIFENVSNPTSDYYYDLVSEYLKIIPQRVGKSVKGFVAESFSTSDGLEKQKELLESLEVSYKLIEQQSNDTGQDEKLFDVSLGELKDDVIYKRLESTFYKTKKAIHNYGNIKIANIYSVNIGDMAASFDSDKIGNIREYYHGTNIANCLSILKSGLRISPPTTASVAGKMFGNGIYGANSSSKSLGYSLGRWGQGKSNSGAWLFVCDFAMGKTYKPTGIIKNPPKGFHSVSALSSICKRLHNDEFIVYKNNQVNIKYLIECSV